MQNCVSTETLPVLMSGSPSEFFEIHKGLRQGDPLSPLLFDLCANEMSVTLNQLLEGNDCYGVHLRGGMFLNHLRFANDVLLFCESNYKHVKMLVDAVEAFLFVSNHQLNFLNSELIGVNMLLNFSIGLLPILYLGGPLGQWSKKERILEAGHG